MDIRFQDDPSTGVPHICEHEVDEEEVSEVLLGPGEDLPANRHSRMKVGQTGTGRHLLVIYVPDEAPEGVFVITV